MSAVLKVIGAAAAKRCDCGHPKCSIEEEHRDLVEAGAVVAELIDVLREARATYLPSPTGINTKRLHKNAAFNARVDAILARAGASA